MNNTKGETKEMTRSQVIDYLQKTILHYRFYQLCRLGFEYEYDYGKGKEINSDKSYRYHLFEQTVEAIGDTYCNYDKAIYVAYRHKNHYAGWSFYEEEDADLGRGVIGACRTGDPKAAHKLRVEEQYRSAMPGFMGRAGIEARMAYEEGREGSDDVFDYFSSEDVKEMSYVYLTPKTRILDFYWYSKTLTFDAFISKIKHRRGLCDAGIVVPKEFKAEYIEIMKFFFLSKVPIEIFCLID